MAVVPHQQRSVLYSKMLLKKFRFLLRAQNCEFIAESGVYKSKVGCQKGIASVKENVAKALVKEYRT